MKRKQFQEFCNVASKEYKSIVLHNDFIYETFNSHFESMSENQKSSHIQKRLKDPHMKAYTFFPHNVTQCSDKFNLILIKKATVLFKLHHSVEELLRDMASRFIESKILRDQNIWETDVSNPDILCMEITRDVLLQV